MEKVTLGSKLIALKEQSGLTLANIAKAAGYRQASSIQRYFSEEYDADYLSPGLAKRLVQALVGFGQPPITEADIFRLEQYGFYMERQFQPVVNREVNITRRRINYIEVHGTVPIGIYLGEAEQFIVMSDSVLFYTKPDHLLHRLIEGALVSVDSMSPRYKTGDVVFYDSDMPAAPGQDVIIWPSTSIRGDEGDADITPRGQLGDAVLAQLVKRTRTTLTLATHSPAAEFEVARADIDAIYPILSLLDFLTQKTEQSAYVKS